MTDEVSLPDMRARVLAGEVPAPQEMAELVRRLAYDRQSKVRKAAAKSKAQHFDVNTLFDNGGQNDPAKS